MISKKLFRSISDIQTIQKLATQCPESVAIHSLDETIRVDAKSFIGMFALNFDEPVFVVSESEKFHKKIEKVGDTILD